jgi:predicted esterase
VFKSELAPRSRSRVDFHTMKIHEGQPVLHAGAPLAAASAVLILLHGRGASGEDMIELGQRLIGDHTTVAVLAPQAAGDTWYPQRFFAPLAQNEPYLTSAMGVVAEAIDELLARGIPREKIILGGFSQGACLALEFVYRHPCRYGAVVAFSGAIIGPPGLRRDTSSSLKGTPVFLGSGQQDAHVPSANVDETAVLFRALKADVLERIYPDLGHTVNEEEIAIVSNLISRVAHG